MRNSTKSWCNSVYCTSEWHQCQLCELEVLFGEGNSDNCDCENYSERYMFYRERYAADDYPEDIENQRDRPAAVIDLLAEGTEGERRKFEALYADRYSDDCNAPEHSGERPRYAGHESAEDKPDYVSKTAHFYHLNNHYTAHPLFCQSDEKLIYSK